MKVVVFAHTPPPFHGQSYMVKLMLDGLRRPGKSNQARDLQLFHVDAKLSSNVEAVGKFQWSKIFALLRYSFAANWHRFAKGADTLYYIPAPGKRVALYRDWIVMSLCRPIFKKLIFHWHAVGLGEWLEQKASPWEKWVTHRLLGQADLSIVLSEFGRADAMRLFPRKIDIVPNGIPDPCPDFNESVLPDRQRRSRERGEGKPTKFTVLFIGACTAAKGLFATLDAIALTNQRFDARKAPSLIRLIVAGEFVSAGDQTQFAKRIAQPDLNRRMGTDTSKSESLIHYAGFVEGAAKNALFREADCLCFPTLYAAEGQPVTVIEALAFGLPVVATRWRGIPDLVTGTEARLIDDQNANAIANALEELIRTEASPVNRNVFLAQYHVDKYINGLRRAFTEMMKPL
ncbi:MAG TPA: glycosyltransferase family 4 protein [Chthoniobacterales bacterium]|nr:glycosyltransferase family 4 protein [Chthoniobacterales bacterium]